jgi:16S rRNA processing protein RimM
VPSTDAAAGGVVVARIGKAHGLRGEVTVQVRTDAPDQRFVPGARFAADPTAAGPLLLRSARDHNGVLLLAFDGVDDRSAAEALRGVTLLASADAETQEEDAWFESDLAGLAVLLPSGERVGEVASVEARPSQDLLVVRLSDGVEARVPFVRALVPVVDVDGGHVVIDPPEGLLELGRG